MASILDLYNGAQKDLGLDKIKTDLNSIAARETPYSEDKGFNADTKVLTDDFLKSGRNGALNTTTYSSTVQK